MSDNSCRILLIEDNLVNAKFIEKLLLESQKSSLAQGLSFELTSCETLASAMEILNQTKFDAILLDLILPDSKGMESLVTLKQDLRKQEKKK